MAGEQEIDHQFREVVIPTEEDMPLERPYSKPVNEPWQVGIHAREKKTGDVVHVRSVEYPTRMFRAVGDHRTLWRSMDLYDPLVKPSEEELEKRAAVTELEQELAALSPEQMAIVEALALDADDPRVRLKKLRALRAIGTLQVAGASVVEPSSKASEGGPYRSGKK